MAPRPPLLIALVLAAIRAVSVVVPRARPRRLAPRMGRRDRAPAPDAESRGATTWRDQMKLVRRPSDRSLTPPGCGASSPATAKSFTTPGTRSGSSAADRPSSSLPRRSSPSASGPRPPWSPCSIGWCCARCPIPQPDRLVALWQRNATTGNLAEEVAPGNFLDWRAQFTTFEAVAASEPYSFDYTGGDRPEVVLATQVTERFFDLLRVRPLYGRLFTDDDHRSATNRLAIVSHAFWERLGSDPTSRRPVDFTRVRALYGGRRPAPSR